MIERATIADSATVICGSEAAQSSGYRRNSYRLEVMSLHIYNSDVSEVTVSLYLVDYGGTAGAGNIIINAFPIPADDTAVIEVVKIVLEQGLTIQAVASTGDVLKSTCTYVIEDIA